MSVVSPMLRAKSSVRSKIGRRISSYPYESNTSRAIRSTRRHFYPSAGRMSCTPRTARIVMWTAFPRALASREENGERNGEAGEDTRSELVVAGDRRGLLRRRLGEQHPVDDLVPQSVDGPRAVVLVGQSRTSGLYRVPCPGLAHAVSVPRPAVIARCLGSRSSMRYRSAAERRIIGMTGARGSGPGA